MPTTRKRTARFQQDWITQTHIDWLYSEPYDAERHDWFVWHDLDDDSQRIRELDVLDRPERRPFLEWAVTGRRLWGMYGAGITEEHVQDHPGTRPSRWWQFNAPEPRQRLGGTGTPCHERLANSLKMLRGVPRDWISDDEIETFERMGMPLGVPAIDESDPPRFESEASYLERLNLFMPGEGKQIKPAAFEPESVFFIIEFVDG